MADVVKGMKLKDNDPRHKDRIVTVIEVLGDYAIYACRTRRCRIKLDRIHDDGKRRNTGFEIVGS